MKSLAFIQPSIEIYRNDFYSRLNKVFALSLFASKRNILLDKDINYKKIIHLETKYFEIQFFNYLNAFKSDHIVLTGNLKLLSNYIIIFLNIFFKRKIYFLNHVLSKKHSKSKFIINKIIYYFLNGVITYNKIEEKFLKRFYGLKKCKSIDNGLIKVDQNDINFNKREKIFTIIFIGKITKKVDFDFLIDSLSKFNKKCHLNIVTTSLSIRKIDKKLDELKRFNRLISIDTYVDIHENNLLINIFNNSHFMVYPGSIGLSLIHSLNFGVPVIIPKRRYFHKPEIYAFKHNHNGFYYKNNHHDFINVILNCLNIYKTKKYQIIVKNSVNTVKNNFNIEEMVKNLIELIDI